MRFPDRETAVGWYNSPEYQQLIDVRNVAMASRFSLLDGLPKPHGKREGIRMSTVARKDGAHHRRQLRDRQGGGPATGITSRVRPHLPGLPEPERASTAKAELEAATGRTIFDIVLMDVADLASVRAGLADIDGSVDALVMNAGVIGPQTLADR